MSGGPRHGYRGARAYGRDMAKRIAALARMIDGEQHKPKPQPKEKRT